MTNRPLIWVVHPVLIILNIQWRYPTSRPRPPPCPPPSPWPSLWWTIAFFQNDHLSLVLGGPVLIIPISHLGISSSSSYIWASLFKCQKVWLNVDCSALAHGLILIRFIPPALQPNYPYMEHGSNYPFLVNYSNGPVINWQIQLTVIHGFAEL